MYHRGEKGMDEMRMVMKKWLMMGLSLLLMMGCSSKQQGNDRAFTYLLFATPLEEHAIWKRVKSGFEKACTEEGYYCDWIGPKTIDTNAMNDVVMTGILQKADVIITQGVIDPSLIEKAQENDIPIVLVDSDMADTSRNVYFGKDFHEQAEVLLEDIEKRWGEDKHLTITIQVAEADFEIAREQVQQIKEVFQTHAGGFEIVDVTSSKSDQVRAKKEWYASFTKHSDVNVALNFASESVESCYEMANELGMKEQMLIYGVDDLPGTVALLHENAITGSIVTPWYDYGYETVKFIAQHGNELKKLHEVHPIHIKLVTPETIEEYQHEVNE